MFKFFRRVRQALLSESKFSKYLLYAIGEIALVMIGILLALQVNNWNEERLKKNREQVYLNLLLRDLNTDIEFYKSNIEFYDLVLESGIKVLDYSDGINDRKYTNWELLVDAFHASQIWPIIIESATYEELKSAGELSILNNSVLRDRLGYYYGGGTSRYQSTIGINPPYRKMARMQIPFSILDYMWDECHETVGDIQVLHKCDPVITEEKAGEILNKLTNNKELMGELGFFMSAIRGGFEPLREQFKLSELIVNEINKSLEKDN
jgi:hypothetical protein